MLVTQPLYNLRAYDCASLWEQRNARIDASFKPDRRPADATQPSACAIEYPSPDIRFESVGTKLHFSSRNQRYCPTAGRYSPEDTVHIYCAEVRRLDLSLPYSPVCYEKASSLTLDAPRTFAHFANGGRQIRTPPNMVCAVGESPVIRMAA